jgi:hypothetical protein
MSLRLQLHLILATLIASFSILLVVQQVEDTRRSVREEVEAASIVASQVLTRSAGSTSRPACRAWCSFCS